MGCSLLTSLDGLSDGAGAGDSGADVVPASVTDGAVDGAGDAGGADAAPGATFCASTSADFCVDFDEGARDDGWSGHDTRGTGALELDTSKSTSPPRSLHASWPRVDLGTNNYQQLTKTWPGAARPMTVDFDVLVAPIAWNANDKGTTIAELYFDKSEKTGVLLVLGSTTWDVSIVTPTSASASVPSPFPTGTWAHLRIDADPGASGGSVTVSLNGQALVQKTGLSFAQDPTETQLWIGLGASNAPVPGIDVHYDNVVVSLH